MASAAMANVLSDEKKQQVIALGQLGWTLRRSQQATGVRRETASVYLRAAGIAIRPLGGWGRRAIPKPAKEVITDPGAEPAPVPAVPPSRSPSASACEPYRELIELALAWSEPWANDQIMSTNC